VTIDESQPEEEPMIKSAARVQLGLGKSVALLLVTLFAAVAMYFAATPSPALAQTEYHFCQVTLAPYGQNGDRCSAWGGGYLFEAGVIGYNHSACIDFTNGIDNNLMYSWACAPAPQPGQFTYKAVNYGNDGVYRKPIIRNNTTGDSNKVEGWYKCYTDC
jgi:hypothetical protein